MSEKREGKFFEDEFENLEEELEGEEKFLRSFESNKSPTKILFDIYKGNYFRIIKSSFFYFLKYIPCIVRPIITALLIDLAVDAIVENSAPNYKLMAIYFGVMAILIALNVPLNYVHSKNYTRAIREVEAKLRSSMVRKLQHLSISFHKEMQSGRIQSKVMRDVEAIETMSSQLFTSILGIICSLVASVVVTATKSLLVLGMFVILVPISVVIIMFFRKSIQKSNREFRAEIESTSAAVMEMVELIPVTKAHALEEIEASKIEAKLKQVAKRGYALDMIHSIFGSVNWASFQLFQVICLGFTVLLAFKKIISIGDITLYQSYFTTIVGDICSILGLVPILTKGFESVKSVGDILGAFDIDDSEEGKIKCEKLSGKYDFEDVYFSYNSAFGENKVINGLNLSVNAGETIALVGESGSGKSTILNLVIGFYKSASGKVLIDGVDIKDLDMHSYRKHLAVVPQSSVLFSGTIKENITFGMESVSEGELWRAIKAANLEKMVYEMPQGLNTQVGEHGDKLSGGQKQRISIARAIIRKPDVIIFDEATSALDTVSEKLIQEAIDNLCRGKTTFIVAHRLSTIRNADKIAVIDKGRCIEYGTYEELMEKKGEFYKFKSLQS